MAFFWAPGCSSWLSGVLDTKFDDVRYDSWRGSFTMRQSHHYTSACILDLAATSGGDEMDSTLEYILSDACGFLWLRPFVPGA
jgi:hypothetical protein